MRYFLFMESVILIFRQYRPFESRSIALNSRLRAIKMSSDSEYKFPDEPTRDQLHEMIDKGLVSSSTKCEFSSLHKGRWTYLFKPNKGTYYYISGGESTYESAYGLSLQATSTLDSRMENMSD